MHSHYATRCSGSPHAAPTQLGYYLQATGLHVSLLLLITLFPDFLFLETSVRDGDGRQLHFSILEEVLDDSSVMYCTNK